MASPPFVPAPAVALGASLIRAETQKVGQGRRRLSAYCANSQTPTRLLLAVLPPAPSAKLLFCEPARPRLNVEPCWVVSLWWMLDESWSLPSITLMASPPEAAPALDCWAVTPNRADALEPCEAATAPEVDEVLPEPRAMPRSMAEAGSQQQPKRAGR